MSFSESLRYGGDDSTCYLAVAWEHDRAAFPYVHICYRGEHPTIYGTLVSGGGLGVEFEAW